MEESNRADSTADFVRRGQRRSQGKWVFAFVMTAAGAILLLAAFRVSRVPPPLASASDVPPLATPLTRAGDPQVPVAATSPAGPAASTVSSVARPRHLRPKPSPPKRTAPKSRHE